MNDLNEAKLKPFKNLINTFLARELMKAENFDVIERFMGCYDCMYFTDLTLAETMALIETCNINRRPKCQT